MRSKSLRVGKTTLMIVGAGLCVAAGATKIGMRRDAQPGLWEVSRSASGVAPERICLADPMLLSQWEHRGGSCTRVVIAGHEADTLIHYSCLGGGFGQSTLTMLTPRSLRVETQGISDNLPFAYALFARRVGNCPIR